MCDSTVFKGCPMARAISAKVMSVDWRSVRTRRWWSLSVAMAAVTASASSVASSSESGFDAAAGGEA